jgi:multidrug efflux pump subunit AcrB
MPLNLAGRLAKTFITSKLTIVFLAVSLLLGALAVVMTPREENPQIVVPGAMVTVALLGASAEEVDRLVVAPLEGVLSEMTGVDHSYGVAQPGVGIVQVQFKVGQPPEDSLVKLYNRVIANRGRLPADAGLPLIQAVDADDVPIVTVTLASSAYDDHGLKRLADSVAERLRSTPGVSVVSVHGGRDREISVALDPVRLQAFSITLTEARGALGASDMGLNLAGPVTSGNVERLRYSGELGSAAAVRDLVIGVRGGRTIKIGDVATVSDGPRDEVTRLSRFAFAAGDPRAKLGEGEMPAVTIAVAKKKGENAVTVSEAVAGRVARMQANFIPRAVHVVTTRDDGQKADEAVNGLMEHLGIALVTVSFIMLLFLGWREALIVSVTVPVIFSITLGADLLGGVTINRITLFALILALGLLVDASIVVIENIHRHYHHERSDASKEDVTVLATNEIGGATNLATFAVTISTPSPIMCRSQCSLPSLSPISSHPGPPTAGSSGRPRPAACSTARTKKTAKRMASTSPTGCVTPICGSSGRCRNARRRARRSWSAPLSHLSSRRHRAVGSSFVRRAWAARFHRSASPWASCPRTTRIRSTS